MIEKIIDYKVTLLHPSGKANISVVLTDEEFKLWEPFLIKFEVILASYKQ